jgi:hypothetical protein
LERANLRRKWSTIRKQQYFYNQPSRFTVWRLFVSRDNAQGSFEIARVLVRFYHVARFIVNTNQGSANFHPP